MAGVQAVPALGDDAHGHYDADDYSSLNDSAITEATLPLSDEHFRLERAYEADIDRDVHAARGTPSERARADPTRPSCDGFHVLRIPQDCRVPVAACPANVCVDESVEGRHEAHAVYRLPAFVVAVVREIQRAQELHLGCARLFFAGRDSSLLQLFKCRTVLQLRHKHREGCLVDAEILPPDAVRIIAVDVSVHGAAAPLLGRPEHFSPRPSRGREIRHEQKLCQQQATSV